MSSPAAASGMRGDVVGERPEQVALDRRQRAAGEPDRVGRDAQVAAHQGEVAGLDGDVGAGAHGQAEVGLGEGGGVVDAVADHRHDPALGLQPLDDVDLVGGQDLGDHVAASMPTSRGDRAGGRRVVAGEQHRAQAEVAQLGDRLGGGRLDRVGDDEHAAGRAVPADRDGGAAGGLRRRRRPRRGRRAGAATSRRAARGDRRRRRGRRRRPGRRGPRGWRSPRPGSSAGRRAAPAAMARAIGCSEASSSGAGEAQHLVGVLARRRRRRRRRVICAGGDGAGLVEHDGVDRGGSTRAPRGP